MAKGFKFTARSAKRISDTVRRVESSSLNSIPPQRQNLSGDIRWFSVYNDSGEDMPGYGVGWVTSDSPKALYAGKIIPRIKKPGTTFARSYVVANPFGIPAGKNGLVTIDPLIEVLYDPSGSPANGEGWGPKPGEWALFKGYPQTALVQGVVDSSRKILLARWGTIDSGIGKANATIANRASGGISIWRGTFGSEADISGMDPTAFNLGPEVSSGDWVSWEFKNGQMCFGKLCDGA